MTTASTKVNFNLSLQQIRNAYQALSNVPTECRKEMLALFDEYHAEWKYQLPEDARFRMQQLEDRETWAIETMGILAATACVYGFPVSP